MPDKILIAFLVIDALFVMSGGLLLAIVFITKASMQRPRTSANVAWNLLLMNTPLIGTMLFDPGSLACFQLLMLLRD